MASLGEIKIEIKGANGVYYKGYVKSVRKEDIVVGFENEAFQARPVPYSDVRLPHTLQPGYDFKEHEEVEVLSSRSDDEPYGWWPARIKMMKGDFAVVEYTGWETTYSDIVQVDRVRLQSWCRPVTSSSFHSCKLPVPDDLMDLLGDDLSAFSDLLKACSVGLITYQPQDKALAVMATDESAIKRVSILGECHVKNTREKLLLKRRADDAARKLQGNRQTPAAPPAPFKQEFHVRADLMGLAIGKHGANVQRARAVEGVSGIELDEDTGTFKVLGTEEAGVKKARALLEFTERSHDVPRDLTARIIGRNGRNIMDMVDKSGIVRVKIEGVKEGDAPSSVEGSESPTCTFLIVGTAESIENVKMLIDFQVQHLREVETLREEMHKLEHEAFDSSQLESGSRPSWGQQRGGGGRGFRRGGADSYRGGRGRGGGDRAGRGGGRGRGGGWGRPPAQHDGGASSGDEQTGEGYRPDDYAPRGGRGGGRGYSQDGEGRGRGGRGGGRRPRRGRGWAREGSREEEEYAEGGDSRRRQVDEQESASESDAPGRGEDWGPTHDAGSGAAAGEEGAAAVPKAQRNRKPRPNGKSTNRAKDAPATSQ